MKIFVKTLKGARFEIQVNPEDSVADVKKNIENVVGVTAAEQMLIHKGKVLKDETTLEANNVSEKSTIAVIKRKPASAGTPIASASLESQVHAATPAEPAWDAGLDLNYEPIPESNIQRLLEISGGTWGRDMVVDALRLACNDLDKALESLYFGLPPVQSEVPDITEEQTQESGTPVADLERSFGFLLGTSELEYLRAMAKSNPGIVEVYVEMIEEQDPELFQLIQNNKAGFLRFLLEGGTRGNEMEQPQELQADPTNEPNNGGDGDNRVGESEETKVEVATPEDDELIAQLEAMGFERGDAGAAYFASNRDAQEAANRLLDSNHK